MKTSKLILVVLGLQLCATCSKGFSDKIEVKGEVQTINEQSSMEGYNMKLKESEIGISPFSSVQTSSLAETNIDENGHFDFGEVEIRRGNKYEYHVVVDTKDELFMGATSYLPFVEMSKEVFHTEYQYMELTVCKAGKLKFQLFNDSPENDNDSIAVKLQTPWWNQLVANYSGAGGYENASYNVRADYLTVMAGKLDVEWLVYRNGVESVFTDQIYLEHNEERSY